MGGFGAGGGHDTCILEHRDIKMLNVLQTLEKEFVVQINYLDYWLHIGVKPCLKWETVKKILSSLILGLDTATWWLLLKEQCSCVALVYASFRLCISCTIYLIEIIEPLSDLPPNLEQYCALGAIHVHEVRICWPSEEILYSAGFCWFHFLGFSLDSPSKDFSVQAGSD